MRVAAPSAAAAAKRAAQTLIDRAFAAHATGASAATAVSSSANSVVGAADSSASTSTWEARRWDEDEDDGSASGASSLSSSSSAAASSSASASAARTLTIGGDRFFVTPTVLTLIEHLGALLAVPASLGGACGADALHRAVDSCNAFNSRACQLVLGAGAMQSGARFGSRAHE
jgi:hypothetical protein